MIYTTGFLLVAALLLDWIIGDPRKLPHPVVGIGKLISVLTKHWNLGTEQARKRKGFLLMLTVVFFIWGLTWGIVGIFTWLHPAAGAAVSIWLTAAAIACKGLKEAAASVLVPLRNNDLINARAALSMIVGRDTKTLSEQEVVRGTVETVAENTVDGVTAPLFWAMIGGAPLAMAYRAVNTLDSMVGYKSEEFSSFGWASARLDDAVNWLPARLTAAAIWTASFFIPGSRRGEGVKVAWRDAKKHPSPNSGWSEALVAGLLGIKLGGTNYYQGIPSVRAEMGNGSRPLTQEDIVRSVYYLYGGAAVFTGMCLLILFLVEAI